MYRRIIIGLLCAATCWCCSKTELAYDTVYVIKPWTQRYNNALLTSVPNVKVFAFGVDTADWSVASYQNALDGILTSRTRPGEQFSTPIAIGEPFGTVDTMPNSADWLKMSIHTMSMMVVVVDPTQKLYAYTQQRFIENLSTLYISVMYQPWRDFNRYTNGSWTYVNDFYDPSAPKSADYILKPQLQKTEKGEAPPLKISNLYAFVADTTNWYVASFDDAKAGTITSRVNPLEKRTTPNYTSYPDKGGVNEGWRRLSVKDSILLIVSVDTVNKNYAYREKKLTLGSSDTQEALIYQSWRSDSPYVDKDWRIVIAPLPQKDKARSSR